VPVDRALRLQVDRDGSAARLSWRAADAGAGRVAYRVLRAPGDGCDHHDRGAQNCILRMSQVATVRGTSWNGPGPAGWTYRVAVVADQHPDRIGGDLVVISPPAR